MKIICDTNIWYNIGNNKIEVASFLKENDILIATISVLELAITENNLYELEYTRKAIQSMIKHSGKSAIIDPPIYYIIKLIYPLYEYNQSLIHSLLQFTERIANGESIDKSKIDEYKRICSEKKNSLIFLANFTNQKALQIKKSINNKDQHRNRDATSLCKQLISELFFSYSGKVLSPDFDWSQIELFMKLFEAYLKEIETGAKVSKENDWCDLFLSIYVQPGMKIWTRDKYWIALIKKIGMEGYLFES